MGKIKNNKPEETLEKKAPNSSLENICQRERSGPKIGAESCGYTNNADVNAAKNIIAAGLAVTGRGGTPHANKHSDPMKRQLLEAEVA